MAELEGELEFSEGIVLRDLEIINFVTATVKCYSYEICKGSRRLYWYDPQLHLSDLALASAHTHKHVPPDIKHHRLLAPELSFD